MVDALLIAREWRDHDGALEITLWGRSALGVVRARFLDEEAVFFVPRDQEVPGRPLRREPRPLVTREGLPVDAVYFRSQRALIEAREAMRARLGTPLESDVKPSDRFVMERFVTGGFSLVGGQERWIEHGGGRVLEVTGARLRPADVGLPLSVLSLDLETDGWDGPVIAAAIAGRTASGEAFEEGLVVGPARDVPGCRFAPDERALLTALAARIVHHDPDAIVGWNVIEFDLTVLETRMRQLGLPMAIGRLGERARILPGQNRSERALARVPGRVVLDGPLTLKTATITFERYSLEHVSRAVLGRGKRIATGVDPVLEIRRMHRDDPAALFAYNLEDARLCLEVFDRTGLFAFVVERARLTGLPLERAGGAVAAFDHLYLPRLHRRGFVAPDVAVDLEVTASPGGHVLEPRPGLYRDVLSFDFRSLYPSLILTFGIDPLGLWAKGEDPVVVEGGTAFARTGSILAEILEPLWEARARARDEGREALSRAIKIQMNSFYGVLGTPGCRFFDPRLPTAITRRGHAIIERARRFFEERGYEVLYGDTDSLFVAAPGVADLPELGQRLAAEVTARIADELLESHRVRSRLELRLDLVFDRFLLPTMRGSERGSKKRYAGWARRRDGHELVVRGLEAVRTDWTPLARRIQRELFTRVFTDQPYQAWLREVRQALSSGALDGELVYEKRLRRRPSEYTAAPPHVRAALEREGEDEDDASEIAYVITLAGPQPVERRTSPIDHQHYEEKQLAPACDVMLHALGTDFSRVAGPQLSLF